MTVPGSNDSIATLWIFQQLSTTINISRPVQADARVIHPKKCSRFCYHAYLPHTPSPFHIPSQISPTQPIPSGTALPYASTVSPAGRQRIRQWLPCAVPMIRYRGGESLDLHRLYRFIEQSLRDKTAICIEESLTQENNLYWNSRTWMAIPIRIWRTGRAVLGKQQNRRGPSEEVKLVE